MSAFAPPHAMQLRSQHGLMSTATQLCPLGQIVPGAQSVASKQPAVKGGGWTHAGTSQRQPLWAWHMVGVVNEVHGRGGEHGGTTIVQVPFGKQCADGPHPPPGA
jgi:hypothetical protein